MSTMTRLRRFCGALVVVSLAGAAHAQEVAVRDAWIRGTVQGQSATGAFMALTARSPMQLVGASSPAARTVEVHNMTMENGVMKMFPVDRVDLPAGKTVRLAPGGYHVMLNGLHKPLGAGDRVLLTLIFELPDRSRRTVEVTAGVRALGTGANHAH